MVIRVDVAVALQKSILDGLTDLVGLGLPGTETNGRDLVPGVQGVGLPGIPNKTMLVRVLRSGMCQSKQLKC